MTSAPLITDSGACRHNPGGDRRQRSRHTWLKGAVATAKAYCQASYFSIKVKLSQRVSFAPPLPTEK